MAQSRNHKPLPLWRTIVLLTIQCMPLLLINSTNSFAIFGAQIELRLLENVIALDESFCTQGISATLTIIDNQRHLYVNKDHPIAHTRFPYHRGKRFRLVTTCHMEGNKNQHTTFIGGTKAHSISWIRPHYYSTYDGYNFDDALTNQGILRYIYPHKQWIGVFERPTTNDSSNPKPVIIPLTRGDYRPISWRNHDVPDSIEGHRRNHIAIVF